MLIVLCGLIFVLAGLVKGLLGMGLPTLAMALLVVLMPSPEAAALLLLPSVLTNLWQMGAPASALRMCRRLLPLLVGITLATLVTTRWLTQGNSAVIHPVLGTVLVVYALAGLVRLRLPPPGRLEAWLSFPVGLATGALSGVTGVFVIPAVPWLQALRLGKDDLVQALAICFLVATLALGAGLWLHGEGRRLDLWGSAAMVLPTLIGMYLGQRLRQRVTEALFQRLFYLGLLALGLAAWW